MTERARIAVVTGANRGIGHEVARQLAARGLRVIATSRDLEKITPIAGDVVRHLLDVTDEASVLSLRDFVHSTQGRIDVLVNNAGVALDRSEGALTVPAEIVRATFETNVVGPLRLCQALVPLMRQGGYGRVVNVSSGMGQLADMQGGWPGYRISKAALNALTRMVAAEVGGAPILVNSACPGWVRTDMGGEQAPRSVEEGADTIVWLATLPDGGPTGGFFRDRKPIAW